MAHMMRVDATLLKQPLEKFLLGWGVRIGDRVRIAALISLDSPDDTMNPVSFDKRVLYFLQYEDTATFRSTIPISRGVKGLALARGAEEVSSVKTKIHLGVCG